MDHTGKARCHWARHPLEVAYHDTEWGVPVSDDTKHFEFLVLDAFQAGLSWLTILKKRDRFRIAFQNFDVEAIAQFKDRDINALLLDQGIIRNEMKIRATVHNAQAFLRVQEEFGSFNHYVWSFVNHRPLINTWGHYSEIPAKTAVSDTMSQDLKNRGFKFVGSTICYAYMQAAGLVNDHETCCFRYHDVIKK